MASKERHVALSWRDEALYVQMRSGTQRLRQARLRGRLAMGWRALSYTQAYNLVARLNQHPVVVTPRTTRPGDPPYVPERELEFRVISDLPSTDRLTGGLFELEVELETLHVFDSVPLGLEEVGVPYWQGEDVFLIGIEGNLPPAFVLPDIAEGLTFEQASAENEAPVWELPNIGEGLTFARPAPEDDNAPQIDTPFSWSVPGDGTDSIPAYVICEDLEGSDITHMDALWGFAQGVHVIDFIVERQRWAGGYWADDQDMSVPSSKRRMVLRMRAENTTTSPQQMQITCTARDQYGNQRTATFYAVVDTGEGAGGPGYDPPVFQE